MKTQVYKFNRSFLTSCAFCAQEVFLIHTCFPSNGEILTINCSEHDLFCVNLFIILCGFIGDYTMEEGRYCEEEHVPSGCHRLPALRGLGKLRESTLSS